MPSAVCVRVHLPSGLERLRRRRVANAADGVPAHMTLLHPFVEPDGLGPPVRRRLRDVAATHPPFGYRQSGMAEWPDAIYVAVEPVAPFVRLQHDLQTAFPEWPLYGPDFDLDFEPHITVAHGEGILAPGVREDRAWLALPRPARVSSIDVIATDPVGHWRLVWRIPLGERPADRIRP
jgi:2'-5' RNA ligase